MEVVKICQNSHLLQAVESMEASLSVVSLSSFVQFVQASLPMTSTNQNNVCHMCCGSKFNSPYVYMTQ